MKKLVLLLAFFAFIGMEVLYAQSRTITGKVINAEDGSSIPGVSVSVKGTTLGIITDMEGRYTLKVPESAEALIFSFVGMRTQEVPITSDRIDIQMEPDVVGVDEVVVVAYGTQRKEAKTGAVDVVSSSQLEDVPVSSAEKLLQGKVAGVQINSGSGLPGSGTQLRIRGYSSINAGKEPLYVIDGVPVVNGDYSLTNNTNNVLASLNPNNIESITVLKDAAAASIYGSRAANGVVLITTKTGKAGRTVFKLNAQYGFSQKTNDSNFRFMNPEEIWTYMRDAVRNIGQDPDNPALANSNLYFPKSLLGGELTNWWNEVFRTGINQKYELSASGGDEKTRFRISGEYYNTQGIQIGSGMERISMQINLDHKISEKATIGLRSFGAYKYVKDQANDLAYANPFWAASSLLPWENAYNPDGTFNWDLPSNNNSNPLGNVALNQQWNKDHHYFASLYFTYQIIPGLEFKTQNSHDYLTNQGRIYWNPETPDGENYDGYVYEAVNQNRTLTTTNTLRYNNVFGEKHSVDALVGYEVTDNKYYAYTMEGGGASADLPYLSNVSKDKDIGYSLSSWAFQSFIGKLDYNFDQRYFLSLSARRDGSSRFGENNRWATFWSVGGSWNAHNEGFMDGLSWVNVAKLRGSYGISGNAAIGNYESYGVYGSRTYNGLGGLAPNQLANPDLTWEDNTSMNIGLDLTLFERFNATVDYYDRKTSNMLLSVPLSRTTGFTSISQNVGSLTNKGLEVAADYDVVKAPFKWNLGFNISFNKVQITDLAGQEEIADGWWRRYRVGGKGFSEYYVYDYAGVNPVDGNALWYDEAGKITENAADARRVYKGKVDPDFFGGFTSSFSWKGFTVDAYFNFSYGNSVYIMERRYIDSDGYNWGSIQSANLLPYWREPGDLVPNPKPIPNNTSDSNAWGTSRFLEDGSFLRFKSLTVSYNIPKEWVAKAKLNSARIYMNAVNLYAWDDVSYWDPERDVTGGGYATYPNPRTITFGVDLGF